MLLANLNKMIFSSYLSLFILLEAFSSPLSEIVNSYSLFLFMTKILTF